MSSDKSHEIGWLAGTTYHVEGAAGAPSTGEQLWRDTSHIRKGGDWRPEELRTVELPIGKTAVFGECLATDTELSSCSKRALESGDMSAMTSMPGSYTSIVNAPDGMHFVGDMASQHPLYIKPHEDGGVSFATQTKPFRTGPGAAPPDRLTLAINVGMPWLHELSAGRTAVQGVSAALPQHSLHADKSGRITTHRHDSIVPPAPLRPEEAAERLREALVTGAKRRADTGRTISADFSGGYDSTSAAYVLGAAIQAPLTVVTQHSPDMPIDDMRYVEQYLRLPESDGTFVHHIYNVPAANAMYRGIGTVPPGDLPDISIRDRHNYQDYYGFLQSLGSELHINGVGADDLFDMSPSAYLGSLSGLANLPYFARAVLQAARTTKSSVRNVLAGIKRVDALDPKTRLETAAHILSTPGTYDSDLLDDVFGAATAPQWLRPGMRQEIAEYAAERASNIDIPDGISPADYRAYANMLAMGPSQHGINENARRAGMRTSTMYFDNDVLKACFGLPAHERVDPWVFKKLMGRALQGIVPSEVTSRTAKGNYTKHGFAGLRAAQDDLRALMQDSRLADLGIIEPAKVKTAFENGLIGANMQWASFDSLIASEVWLRSLDNVSWGARTYAAPAPPPAVKPTAPVAHERYVLNDHSVYGMPPDVIVAARKNGAAVVNMATDKYLRLNTYALSMLKALEANGSLGAAYNSLELTYPDVEPAALRNIAKRWMHDLLDAGIVAEGEEKFAILDSNLDDAEVLPIQMVFEGDKTPRVRIMDYAAALGGIIMGRVLERSQSTAAQFGSMAKVRSALGRQPETAERLTRTLAACRRISKLSIGRAACLELSRAAVLGSALRGRYADLVLGVRTDPESFHAWPQTVDGTAIRTDADEQIDSVYQPLIRL